MVQKKQMPKSIAKQYFKLGEIIVHEQNYTMALKTFYKVTQLGNKTLVAEELEKKDVTPMNEFYEFYVMPTETIKPNGNVLRLTVHTDGTLTRSTDYGVFVKYNPNKN